MPQSPSLTRPLILTAGLGLLVSIASCSIAGALGGFHVADWHERMWGDGWRGLAVNGDGPTVTRELTWPGGHELAIQIPASVTFTQGPAAKVTVTGPQGTVEHVEFHDGDLRFDRRIHDEGPIQVTITAPDVREFSVMGSGDLDLHNIDQDHVELHIFGSGDVAAEGRVREVELDVAGSGRADLSKLPTDNAEVNVAGSGRTVIAPKERAELNVAGSGEVVLTTRPRTVETHIMGSGRVTQAAPETAPAPAAPATPAAPSGAHETSLQAA
jgi:hypothetical protein